MEGLCAQRWPPYSCPNSQLYGNDARPRRLTGSSASRQVFSGVLQYIRAQNVELQHSSIYKDGYVTLHNFLSEAECSTTGNLTSVPSSVLEGQRWKLLRDLVGKVQRIELEASYVQGPGFKCTDSATSPEPWWDAEWMVHNLNGDDQQRLSSASKTASLLISTSGRTAKRYGGGFCVYPRSHWLVADWWWAGSGETRKTSFPDASDVPAAPVVELELGAGDAVLFHPFLLWSLAPNVTRSSATFHLFNLHTERLADQNLSGGKVVQMWHDWTALTSRVKSGLQGFDSEEVELMKEEVKSLKGGWATWSQERILADLSFSCSYLVPHDRLAWQLRMLFNDFSQKGKWAEAMVALQRLAGLRPRSYWVAYMAGRCAVLSVPPGQLAGRAGRKSRLEDAERFLLRAIEMAPGWPLAYGELADVLLLLGRGREQEIPELIRAMYSRCNIERLSSKYPVYQSNFAQCQERCHQIMSQLL